MCTACELLPEDHALLQPSNTSTPSKRQREWDAVVVWKFGRHSRDVSLCTSTVCTCFREMNAFAQNQEKKKGPKQMQRCLVANHQIPCFKAVLTQLMGILAICRLMAQSKPGPICNDALNQG